MERLQGILTELACRSADIPVDMLPIPFNEELILDFGEEAVKDLKSKKEILKFEKSWIEMVEEEEMQQDNLSKVESELKVMAPQIKSKQQMQEELKRVAPKKVQQFRSRFLSTEKARKMWQPVHQELMGLLTKRNMEEIKIQRQKKIIMEMLKELKVVASRDVDRRKAIREKEQTWGEIHEEVMRNMKKKQNQHQTEIMLKMFKELKAVASRVECRKVIMESMETMSRVVHKELMTVLIKRNLEEKQLQMQKATMSEMFKELKIVTSRNVEKKAMIEKRETMWREIHEELMAAWASRELRKKQILQQKQFILEMMKELKVHVTLDTGTKIHKDGKLEEKVENIFRDKTSKPDTTMPEEEQDLFVPRKLFLFNVETFKNSPQDVESVICHKRTEIKNDHCIPSIEKVPTLPKKKSLRGRLRKFFGFK